MEAERGVDPEAVLNLFVEVVKQEAQTRGGVIDVDDATIRQAIIYTAEEADMRRGEAGNDAIALDRTGPQELESHLNQIMDNIRLIQQDAAHPPPPPEGGASVSQSNESRIDNKLRGGSRKVKKTKSSKKHTAARRRRSSKARKARQSRKSRTTRRRR